MAQRIKGGDRPQQSIDAVREGCEGGGGAQYRERERERVQYMYSSCTVGWEELSCPGGTFHDGDPELGGTPPSADPKCIGFALLFSVSAPRVVGERRITVTDCTLPHALT